MNDYFYMQLMKTTYQLMWISVLPKNRLFQSPIEILQTATPGEYFRLNLRLSGSKRAANVVITQGDLTVCIEGESYIIM